MIVIGERINATRKTISRAIQSRNRAVIEAQIEHQDRAGADYIDLNAGMGTGDTRHEVEAMCWLIDIALETTEKQLSIDSANPLIIQKAAEHLDHRRPWLLNSVKKEKHLLEAMLPIAAHHQVPVIALAMDAEEIPEEAGRRVQVCVEIGEEAQKAGVPLDRIYFDPLVMPLSSNHAHGQAALETLQKLKRELPQARTAMGVSNISFGLPQRARINEAFLVAAIAHGLDAALGDPMDEGIRRGLLLGGLIAGQDRYCRRFTRALRKREFDNPL